MEVEVRLLKSSHLITADNNTPGSNEEELVTSLIVPIPNYNSSNQSEDSTGCQCYSFFEVLPCLRSQNCKCLRSLKITNNIHLQGASGTKTVVKDIAFCYRYLKCTNKLPNSFLILKLFFVLTQLTLWFLFCYLLPDCIELTGSFKYSCNLKKFKFLVASQKNL